MTDLAGIGVLVYSTPAIIGRICRCGRCMEFRPGGCMTLYCHNQSRLPLLTACAGLAIALALLPAWSVAGPPRVIEDDDAAVEAAAFTDDVDTPRLLTPRTKSAESGSKPVSPVKRTSAQTSLWGTVLGLLAVFGIFIAGKVWLTRHGPAGLRGLPVEALELLGKRTIEPRVSIHIVRCGPKILVLGVAPDGVRTLTEITDPIEIDMMAGACRKKESGRSGGDSFAGMFRQTASRTGGG